MFELGTIETQKKIAFRRFFRARASFFFLKFIALFLTQMTSCVKLKYRKPSRFGLVAHSNKRRTTVANASAKKVKQPLSQVLVQKILDCQTTNEIRFLLGIVGSVEIREGHEEIIVAIDRFMQRLPMGGSAWAGEILGIESSLREQKTEFKKSLDDTRMKGVSAPELMRELNELSSMLQRYCHGLSTWDKVMREKLIGVHELITRALKPEPTT